jgi:hypothetical protein
MGKYDLAIADLNAVIAADDKPPSLYIRGLAKRKIGDSAGGDADIDRARKADPSVADTFLGYGVTP